MIVLEVVVENVKSGDPSDQRFVQIVVSLDFVNGLLASRLFFLLSAVKQEELISRMPISLLVSPFKTVLSLFVVLFQTKALLVKDSQKMGS